MWQTSMAHEACGQRRRHLTGQCHWRPLNRRWEGVSMWGSYQWRDQVRLRENLSEKNKTYNIELLKKEKICQLDQVGLSQSKSVPILSVTGSVRVCATLLQGPRTNGPCVGNPTEKWGKAGYGTSVGSSISATNSEGETERLLIRISLKKAITAEKAHTYTKYNLKINENNTNSTNTWECLAILVSPSIWLAKGSQHFYTYVRTPFRISSSTTYSYLKKTKTKTAPPSNFKTRKW